VTIEFRWAHGQNDRLAALAVELVRRQVAVIATFDIASAFAAKAATTTIPIVFNTSIDPVAAGLVASLNRPGGNVTGITSLNTVVISKRLEMLHELVPAARIIALLVNPATPKPTEATTTDAQAATSTLGLQLHVVTASSPRDIDTAFTTLAQQGAAALVVSSNALFNSRSEQIAALAARHAIPAIYPAREYVAAGGLISYGTSLSDIYRQVGLYTGKILKGEKPESCRSSNPQRWSWSSISKPRRRLVSPFRSHCSVGRTRSSNKHLLCCGARVRVVAQSGRPRTSAGLSASGAQRTDMLAWLRPHRTLMTHSGHRA
jgi:putative ABC transport system substrate-binding protein